MVIAGKTSRTADRSLEPAVGPHRLVLDPVHSQPLENLQFYARKKKLCTHFRCQFRNRLCILGQGPVDRLDVWVLGHQIHLLD